MDSGDLTVLQQRMEKLAYPPQFSFDLATRVPHPDLAERERNLLRLAPDFFSPGLNFLDVGCNKGYYALKAAATGMNVTGIDSGKNFTDFCEDLFDALQVSGEFQAASFREWRPTRRFDRILLGHVHHHIFKEAGGWEWLAKLRAISLPGAIVVVEGPVGYATSPDLKDVLKGYESEFTPQELLAHFETYGFSLVSQGLSSSYTIGRQILVFELELSDDRGIEDYCLGERLREARMEDPLGKKTFKARRRGSLEPVVLKIKQRALTAEERIQIEMSQWAGDTVPVTSWLRFGTGWEEDFSSARIAKHYECEWDILLTWLARQGPLTRCGYMDCDPCTPNYFIDRGPQLFDKDGVRHVSTFTPEFIKAVIKNFGMSYRTIPAAWLEELASTMGTQDSVLLEGFFAEGNPLKGK